jgi:hypothetical protein
MRNRFAGGLIGAGAISSVAGLLLVSRHGTGSHTYFAGPGIFILPFGGAVLAVGLAYFAALRRDSLAQLVRPK